MADKLKKSEHSTRHDIIQHGLAPNTDHVVIGISSLKRNMASHCKFKRLYSRKGDSAGLTSNIIEPCEQNFDVICDKENMDCEHYYQNKENNDKGKNVVYEGTTNDKLDMNNTGSLNNSVFMGVVSDTNCSNGKRKGLIHVKSFRSLNIDNEEKYNLELFENDEKIRKIENNHEKAMGGINKLSQQICCNNELTSEGEVFRWLLVTKLSFKSQ